MKIWVFKSFTKARIHFILALAFVFCLAASDAYAGKRHYRGMNLVSPLQASDIVALENLIHPGSVRYTISNPAADTQTLDEYRAWLLSELDNFDANLAPVFQQYDIKVIFSIGTPPGGFYSRAAPSPQFKIFADKQYQDAFIDTWNLLALRYKDSSVIAALHLLSEPATGASTPSGVLTWYELQKQLVANVRAVDTTHAIIVTPQYSAPQKLSRIRVPAKSGPLWYCFNFYYPTAFLRQGVENAPYKVSYPSKKASKAMIQRYLKNTIAYARKKKLQLYVSEFTTSRFAPKNAGVRFLKDAIATLNAAGANWSYHAWREADAWSIELPALEDVAPTQPTKRALVLKKYTK